MHISLLSRMRIAASYTLLLLLFIGGSPAAPVESDELTMGNFASTTGKGMWFVEFFSPYCHHCKAFMPTWKLLLEMHGHLSDSSDFHFARVNCIAQGDVCNAQGVAGYPTMFLYTDGKKVDEYKGGRSYEDLSTFILTRAAAHKKQMADSSPNTAKAPHAILPQVEVH